MRGSEMKHKIFYLIFIFLIYNLFFLGLGNNLIKLNTVIWAQQTNSQTNSFVQNEKDETKESLKEIVSDTKNRHKGIFIRILGGVAYNEMYDFESKNTFKGQYYFAGSLQMGYAIVENFIPHVGVKGLLGNFKTTNTIDETQAIWNFTQKSLTAGITLYAMPYNIYITPEYHIITNFDVKRKVVSDIDLSEEITTWDYKGTGISLTIGKEWWVSDHMGMGIAAFYQQDKVNAMKTKTSFGDEEYETNQVSNTQEISAYGIQFSITYN